MDQPTTLVLLALDGGQTPHANTTVFNLMQSIGVSENYLAILRPELGKHLVYDVYDFGLYRHEIKGFDRLLEKHWCNGLYRNRVTLHQGREVYDPGRLWMLRENTLILVDADDHATTPLTDSFDKIA